MPENKPPITRIAILNELHIPVLVVIKQQTTRQRFHATLYPHTPENESRPGAQKIMPGYNIIFPCETHKNLAIKNRLPKDFDIDASEILFTEGENKGHRTQCFFLVEMLN